MFHSDGKYTMSISSATWKLLSGSDLLFGMDLW